MLPTGEQFEIASGAHRAVVTEVGATLRSYTVQGRDVVHGFAVDEIPKGGRGQQLIPWPNRIRDGKYSFDGVDQQLALTEPARHNASHGLARHIPWVATEQADDRVTLRARVFPQPGWPGTLEANLTFGVAEDGLTVTVDAQNLGTTAFPFGYAAHPYLSVGEERVDDISVRVPASSYLEVDDRLLPARVSTVDGTEWDLREPTPIGSRLLDTAMTALERGTDGRWRVELSHGERTAELWADEAFGWVQVFTGGPYRTWSLAVEPMTCGPNAFNAGPTHTDLLVLQPDQHFTAQWGIRGS